MTFGSASLSRSASRAGSFLKREVWVWPIIAVVLLSVLGYAVQGSIEKTMKSSLRSQLETLLSVEEAMLQTYLRAQESNAVSMANDLETRELVQGLISPRSVPAVGAAGVAADKLRAALGPAMASHDYTGFFVADKSQTILAASELDLVGQTENPDFAKFVVPALEGAALVSRPFASVTPLKDEELGKSVTGVPTMFVCAPIRDDAFQVVGVLALRMRPEKEFTRILQLGRIGESGETYAFDGEGRMLSNSRFDDDMILQGLLPDEPGSRSILKLLVRDPGGDVTRGFRPKMRRAELPLTKMVASATTTGAGFDVEGYRDYRGVPVVAAWTWLAPYGFGVATEIDFEEAYRPLTILQRTFWGLFTLLAASSLAIFLFSLALAKQQRRAQKAVVEAEQLGQYKLERKLGAGAMGVVYQGRHAMLRRPTAIKLLNLDNVTEGSIARFEREVQITSQLNHPNTVAIYDYGRTPEGIFYYAMEFLDGIDLEVLVERYGPQPPGRVIQILKQVCGSLYEAHSLGLVHRDVKPANIMLNRRGSEPDVIKVLDFGLVKALDESKKANTTSQGSLTGTPLYMSPEAIQMPESVDSRSDLYAVGAVGYFLLTGKPVFEATSIVDLCQKQIDMVPQTPSSRLGKPVSEGLENTLMTCLEKSRAKRPATAREIADRLSRCPEANTWTIDDADTWWSKHERGLTQSLGMSSSNLAGESQVDREMLVTLIQ